MTFEPELDSEIPQEDEIDRGDTGLRILFTLLFFIIARLVEGVLAVLIFFQLATVLITQREPSDALRRFANHAISYLVRIGRYITYNDPQAPFPFREFPAELDLTVPATPEAD